MTPRQSTITTPVAIYEADGTVVRGTARFEWTIEDAAAVRLTYRTDDWTACDQLIARWILMAGIGSDRMVGDGNVMVHRAGRVTTRIRMVHPEGIVEIVVHTELLIRFLDTCEDACPSGSPAEDDRLAAWISAFLLSNGIAASNRPDPDEEAAIEFARRYAS